MGLFEDVQSNYSRIAVILVLLTAALLILSITGVFTYDDEVGVPYYIGGFLTIIFTVCQAIACAKVAVHGQRPGAQDTRLTTKWMKIQYVLSMVDIIACFICLIIVSIASGRYDNEEYNNTDNYIHNKRITNAILSFCLLVVLVTLYAMISVCKSGPKYGVHVMKKPARISVTSDSNGPINGPNGRASDLFFVTSDHQLNRHIHGQPNRLILPPLENRNYPTGNQQYNERHPQDNNNIETMHQNRSRERNQSENNFGTNPQQPRSQLDLGGNHANIRAGNQVNNQPIRSMQDWGGNVRNQPYDDQPPPYSVLYPDRSIQPSAPPAPY